MKNALTFFILFLAIQLGSVSAEQNIIAINGNYKIGITLEKRPHISQNIFASTNSIIY